MKRFFLNVLIILIFAGVANGQSVGGDNDFTQLPKPKAVEMDVFKTALMFWTRTKHTIKQGMVKITVSKIEHSFEIYSHKLKAEFTNQFIRIHTCFDG